MEAVERLRSTPSAQHCPAWNQTDNSSSKFFQIELDIERESVILLHQQDSRQTEMLWEQSAQQFELLRQQQDAANGSTHTQRPGSLNIDIFKYKKDEENSLFRWFAELNDAIRACLYRRIENASRIRTIELGRMCGD